jgi:hypothetical protein
VASVVGKGGEVGKGARGGGEGVPISTKEVVRWRLHGGDEERVRAPVSGLICYIF